MKRNSVCTLCTVEGLRRACWVVGLADSLCLHQCVFFQRLASVLAGAHLSTDVLTCPLVCLMTCSDGVAAAVALSLRFDAQLGWSRT